jgi:hypothetical protein
MATKLDITVFQTFNKNLISIQDNSQYDTGFVIQQPTIKINVPGFKEVTLPFTPQQMNTFNSQNLELTSIGEPYSPLPDGLYIITYTVEPPAQYKVTKSIYRVDQLMEKYDDTFMSLDMGECNGTVKKQLREELMLAYLALQSTVSSANACAYNLANRLYLLAARQIDSIYNKICNCSGRTHVY